jgi:hypothetical protein
LVFVGELASKLDVEGTAWKRWLEKWSDSWLASRKQAGRNNLPGVLITKLEGRQLAACSSEAVPGTNSWVELNFGQDHPTDRVTEDLAALLSASDLGWLKQGSKQVIELLHLEESKDLAQDRLAAFEGRLGPTEQGAENGVEGLLAA